MMNKRETLKRYTPSYILVIMTIIVMCKNDKYLIHCFWEKLVKRHTNGCWYTQLRFASVIELIKENLEIKNQ